MRPEKTESPAVPQVAHKLKDPLLRSHCLFSPSTACIRLVYKQVNNLCNLYITYTCVFDWKRLASAETRVSRCLQQQENAACVSSAPLNMSFQKKLSYKEETSSFVQESSSEDEVVIWIPQFYPAINKGQVTSCATNVYALYRGAKNGLDCEWQLVS